MNGSTIVPLNMPRPLTVSAGEDGTPRTVQLSGQLAVAVAEVVDTWASMMSGGARKISRPYWHLALAVVIGRPEIRRAGVATTAAE